ncbi:uncharacterized protein BO66DRAFT_141540 [Aspergillus aculeatinus CBS 121060]|uniref:Uncharacterized protein n=1 Tax=Aspergillus aculeatinus CBS 121060 TaxID=1448322 RepID=A0ACD1H376_9EURO|nr:hypothetical protein BO66DRAFT_141540 [Aspergillus aculeatinus CBS 121060]RAH67880.1 hypothetical protein BO66DRAFT_141540 [Aspergillus aculeatinus CBS 121060]
MNGQMRAAAMMSPHRESSEGAESASIHVCQVVHRAYTLGLLLHQLGWGPEDSLSSLFNTPGLRTEYWPA